MRALAERRDAIGRAYLTAINPLTNPVLDANGLLTFRNAAVDADFARAPRSYTATWSTFDNTTGATATICSTNGRSTSIQAPPDLPAGPAAFVMVELRATGAEHLSWEKPVRAYFQRVDQGWRLVGFERLPEAR